MRDIFLLMIGIIFVTLILVTSKNFAQNVQVADTCESWKFVPIKIPGEPLHLKIMTDKKKQEILKWDQIRKSVYLIQIRKAKAIKKGEDKITICSTGTLRVVLTNSVSFKDLHLPKGLYAVSVTDGNVFTSDWITIQIK